MTPTVVAGTAACYAGPPEVTVSIPGLSLVTVPPTTGSAVVCNHCDSIALKIVADCVVVVHRHHGQWHKSVVALADLGYVRVSAVVQ